MTRSRSYAVAIAALSVICAQGSTALAGGWAVTTLDPQSGALVPGSSAEIGYTIRQHGRTPVDVADTGIEVRPEGGAAAFFPGRRKGPVGHYVATVTTPTGPAEWSVRQGLFGPQSLGAMTLTAAGSAGDRSNPSPGPAGWLLLAGTILATGTLTAQLVVRRRQPSPAAG